MVTFYFEPLNCWSALFFQLIEYYYFVVIDSELEFELDFEFDCELDFEFEFELELGVVEIKLEIWSNTFVEWLAVDVEGVKYFARC